MGPDIMKCFETGRRASPIISTSQHDESRRSRVFRDEERDFFSQQQKTKEK